MGFESFWNLAAISVCYFLYGEVKQFVIIMVLFALWYRATFFVFNGIAMSLHYLAC